MVDWTEIRDRQLKEIREEMGCGVGVAIQRWLRVFWKEYKEELDGRYCRDTGPRPL
jgi:hypothetical protein